MSAPSDDTREAFTVARATAPGMADLDNALRALPLIAILRGLRPEESVPVAGALLRCGFRIIEVPLNSPDPLTSIRAIVDAFGDRVMVGAGTVMTAADAIEVAGAGGRLLVAPNCNPEVGAVAARHGLCWIPGVFTPTEAFAALSAGASALKLFPAEALPPAALRAMRAVLPEDALLLPVGGINPGSMAAYREAGANGFGLGSALFKPGRSVDEVERAAQGFVAALHA